MSLTFVCLFWVGSTVCVADGHTLTESLHPVHVSFTRTPQSCYSVCVFYPRFTIMPFVRKLIDTPPYNHLKTEWKVLVFIRRTNMVCQQAKGFVALVIPQWPFPACAEAEIKANGPVFLRLWLNPTLSSSCENTLSQIDLALSPREKVRSSGPALGICCGFSLGEVAALVSDDAGSWKMGLGEKPKQHLCYKSLHKAIDCGIGGIRGKWTPFERSLKFEWTLCAAQIPMSCLPASHRPPCSLNKTNRSRGQVTFPWVYLAIRDLACWKAINKEGHPFGITSTPLLVHFVV